jgi:hypothetical protein
MDERLVSFLKSLTGDNVPKLAAEAWAAKPGETQPEKDRRAGTGAGGA